MTSCACASNQRHYAASNISNRASKTTHELALHQLPHVTEARTNWARQPEGPRHPSVLQVEMRERQQQHLRQAKIVRDLEPLLRSNDLALCRGHHRAGNSQSKANLCPRAPYLCCTTGSITHLSYIRAASKIRSDAFSAIITVGELVLPEVINGMIEASTTRSFPMPCTRNAWSTTASASGPIFAVPTG